MLPEFEHLYLCLRFEVESYVMVLPTSALGNLQIGHALHAVHATSISTSASCAI